MTNNPNGGAFSEQSLQCHCTGATPQQSCSPRLCSEPALLLLLPFSLHPSSGSSPAAALLPWPLPPPVPSRTQLKGSGFTLALCCLCPAVGRVPRGCWGHGLLPGPSACVPATTLGDRFHVLLHDSPFCGPPPSPRPPHWDPSGQHKELNAGGTKGNPG